MPQAALSKFSMRFSDDCRVTVNYTPVSSFSFPWGKLNLDLPKAISLFSFHLRPPLLFPRATIKHLRYLFRAVWHALDKQTRSENTCCRVFLTRFISPLDLAEVVCVWVCAFVCHWISYTMIPVVKKGQLV